ncbi:N-acetylmuramoyl-L-alanine amidase domain-containing protein [Staphylococcus aureus]|nr:N-acetylmuramoyl-L-alanine amidase domain-containing protein [Staphylococcus aureus]GBZ85160.1 N-acetylmuramoyl-L-alanine amidase domain-containing protein [Staphylococcus aureus]
MPKNKILIYLLSTTLVLPTLVSPTAYADTPQKDTTAKTTSHDSKKSNDDELQVKILIKQTTIIQVTKTITTKNLKL